MRIIKIGRNANSKITINREEKEYLSYLEKILKKIDRLEFSGLAINKILKVIRIIYLLRSDFFDQSI
jgi:hypothetical protein